MSSSRFSVLTLAFCIAASAGAACYVGPIEREVAADVDPNEPAGEEGGGTTPPRGPRPDTSPDGVDGEVTLNGLPCEIDDLLERRCRTCHDDGARSPMPLVTYADLIGPSRSDASKTAAEASLERMGSDRAPMPPRGDRATASELAAFGAWLDKGLPPGECGSTIVTDAGAGGPTDAGGGTAKDAGGGSVVDAGAVADAGAVEPTCTSGLMWTSTERGARMHPGRRCIGCHTNSAGRPILQVGGTVYSALDEVDRCFGVQTPAYVVVRDATNRTFTLQTGATGNFALRTTATELVYPISVKVVRGGKEREMKSSPPHGDCNACHTKDGANGAPGRILEP